MSSPYYARFMGTVSKTLIMSVLVATIVSFLWFGKKEKTWGAPSPAIPRPQLLRGPTAVHSVLDVTPEPPMKREAPASPPATEVEGRMERLKRWSEVINSESFVKKALEIEAATKPFEFKDEDLIENNEFGESSFRKYRRADGGEVTIGVSQSHLSEAVMNDKGKITFFRGFEDGRLKTLQLHNEAELARALGHTGESAHTLHFDERGKVSTIFSQMDGDHFLHRYVNGTLTERVTYDEGEEAAEERAF